VEDVVDVLLRNLELHARNDDDDDEFPVYPDLATVTSFSHS